MERAMSTILCTCRKCGKQFYANKYDVERRGGGKYCSRRCYGAGLTIEERFWSRVNKDGPVPAHHPELGPCWVWTAGKFEDGYGAIHTATERRGAVRRPQYAHRVSWELAYGPVPEGFWVLHHCDNPPCVRPAHLFLGTNLDNMQDMAAKQRGLNGIKNHNAKLTDEGVRQLRAYYKAHGRAEAVRFAKEAFDVGESAAVRAMTGDGWKHVD
jgi:hypothetical protein